MTLHHLLPDKKLELYRNIRQTLKPGGKYMEGDYIVSPEKEAECLAQFEELRRDREDIDDGSHHIDIPMSTATLEDLFWKAVSAASSATGRSKKLHYSWPGFEHTTEKVTGLLKC
jgi:tRNA (cmo5U34)-methyltransferase